MTHVQQPLISPSDNSKQFYDAASVKDGQTTTPIRFDWEQLEISGEPSVFLKQLWLQVSANMLLRYRYFESLRSKKSARLKVVRNTKISFLLCGTGLALVGSGIKFVPFELFMKADVWCILLAGCSYALVAILVLFDKISELSSSYFRCIATSLAIRDLIREYNFKILQEMVSASTGDDSKKISWLNISAHYSAQVDALASGEHLEWKEAFQASMAEIDRRSQNGLSDVQKTMKTTAETLQKIVDIEAAKAKP